MAQNYGPGSPYPTTPTGKRMAAAGIPIFAGGQDPSVYMQSGENGVVGRPAQFTGAPGSEAGMTAEMLAKLRASMGGQVPNGPDYEFMPAPGMGSESAPPVMSETMPPGGGVMTSGGYSPDMNPPIAPPMTPPMGGGGEGQGGFTPQFGPPMQPPGSELPPPGTFTPTPTGLPGGWEGQLPPRGGPTGPPLSPPGMPVKKPTGAPPMGAGPTPLPMPGIPPVWNPGKFPPLQKGGKNPKGGQNPRGVPNTRQLMKRYAKKWGKPSGGWGLPPGATGGMQGSPSPYGGSSYPKPRGPRKNVTGPRRVAF